MIGDNLKVGLHAGFGGVLDFNEEDVIQVDAIQSSNFPLGVGDGHILVGFILVGLAGGGVRRG